MKTKSLFRSAVITVSYILVFLCAINTTYAQCPTITNTNPIICDASGFTFGDLNAYAIDNGNGITWYNAATGGASFNSTQLVSQTTYYADDNSGTCGTRESITVDFQVNPTGQNLQGIFCSNENPTIQTYINIELQPNVPPGGSVEVYTNLSLTILANSADPIPNGATNYYIVFVDSSGCKSQIEAGSTALFDAPLDPTPVNPQEFCSDTNPTIGDLDSGTAANFNWYANIDGNGDVVLPALNNTLPLIDGNTYYVQVEGFFCDSNPVPVSVSISDPYYPGVSSTLEYCEDNVQTTDFDLYDELGGSPDIVGTWSGPLTTSNGYLGTVNISSLTTPGIYIFTYTVPANGACPEDTATITITIYETYTSGDVSLLNPATFCEATLPVSFDLFTLLDNEDPDGQWTQGTTSTDPIVSSPIDLSGFTTGTYDFTYTQNVLPNLCLEESTTVQVVVLQDPNAGIAINETFCENELVINSPYDLFTALDGSQDNNLGEWTDANDIIVTNTIDITGFTVAGSPYQFTYTIDNTICTDSEIITITILPSPESGTPIAVFPEFCEGDAPTSFDLFDLLEGEGQTGTWYIGTDNTGSTTANPLDLSGLTTGTYDYTFDVDAIGSCDDELVTVSVTINALPETGTANNPPPFCENDPALNNTAFDLFTLLGAPFDAGGTWTDDNASGALTGSTLDLTQLTIGAYNFTYGITDANSCSSSTTVTIVIDDAPESGTVNNPGPFCISDIITAQTIDLFDFLVDEDQIGTWSDDSSSGALSGNTVVIDGLSAGIYDFTFDVDVIGSCDDVLVTVSIEIADAPAPSAAAIQEFCDSATIGDLFATGTSIQWYDESVEGNLLANDFDLEDGETYYATQTDATTGCESSIRFEITATIYQTPNSGNPNTTPIFACNDDNAIDLNTGLDGTQDMGGTWQDTDGTGALSGSIFDATGIVAGTYDFTYIVSASAPCVDSSTIITVTINEPLSAGSDAILDICSDNGTTDLFTLIGAADTGGTWSPALASGTGVFDPLVDASTTYTYLLTNACGNSSSEVVVTVTQAANAGTDGSISLCVIDGSIDLFNVLGGDPNTSGTWSPTLTSGTGVFDPEFDTAGTYIYSVTATSPCTSNASAQVSVAVNDSSAPTVVEANPIFCLVDTPTIADLDATVSSTGTITWYDDADLTTELMSTEALTDGEDYYATQTIGGACESSVNVQINVTVGDAPTPTLINANLELCINDSPTVNDLTLNIFEYNSTSTNVIWYDFATNGTVITETTELSGSTTYYAVLIDPVTGCESSERLAVSPDLTGCGLLIIPDGFSPNGDGTNDTFDIDNLDILYPNFEIEIFNRYGNVVYKGNASTPRFDGTSNQSRTLVDGDLPVGVYYYIFNYNDGINKPKQGSLYLSR